MNAEVAKSGNRWTDKDKACAPMVNSLIHHGKMFEFPTRLSIS